MSVTITEVRNGVYKENGLIDCEINHPVYGWIPYTISDDDPDTTVDNNTLKTLLGSNIAPFDQAEYDGRVANFVRLQRDIILETEVDPIVTNSLRWGELTTEQQNTWIQYRTDLLNITDQAGFPHNVTWPTKP